jgi:predicted dienelactone hydrolase
MLTASKPRMDGRALDPRAVRPRLIGALLALALAVPATAASRPAAPETGLTASSDAHALPGPESNPVVAIPSLPGPRGPYAIGTLLMDWTDEEREETWTRDPADRRRLVVQCWYPASERPLRVPAPYVLRYAQLRQSLDRFWSRPFPTMATHAALEPPVLESPGPLPVVLFSHGLNSSRMLYTALAEELASRGYVVVAIDHPHWSPGVAFENGRTVGYDESMPGRMAIDADRMDERVQAGIATMAEDQAFVARMLPGMASDRRVNVRRLGRQMDLDRIAVAGHAMGGMAAVRAAYTYRFFKSAVTLDGYAWTISGISPVGSPATPSAKPLLVILSESGVRGDTLAFARRHLDAFDAPRVVRLAGTRPGSITDTGFLNPDGPDDDADAAHRRVCDTLVAFLDEHLRGRGIFDAEIARMTGAEQIDLAGMLDAATRTAIEPRANTPARH